ncbi:MAG TPA: hypothetical protein ENN22_16605 [bacterium]|nr:hypothetical protein [bacterium]
MKKNQIIFGTLLAIIPFVQWVIANPFYNIILFYLLGIFVIFSRYWQPAQPINPVFEIIFLFFLLYVCFSRLHVEKFFPLQNVIIIYLLYFSLFCLKKENRAQLNFRIGELKTTVIFLINLNQHEEYHNEQKNYHQHRRIIHCANLRWPVHLCR